MVRAMHGAGTATPYYDHDGVTIYHGDCLRILPQLPAADCVVADPPFNVGKDYGPGTDDSRADYARWLTDRVQVIASATRAGGAVFLMNETDQLLTTLQAVQAAGLRLENLLVWAFGNPTPAATRFPKTWRPIVFARDPGEPVTWNPDGDALRRSTAYCDLSRHTGKRIVGDLWPDIPKLVGGFLAPPELIRDRDGNFAHLAQMPEALAERPILLTTGAGDLVVDPFMGSGTTLRAAKNLGRRAIGIEVEERFCEMAAARLSQEVFAL